MGDVACYVLGILLIVIGLCIILYGLIKPKDMSWTEVIISVLIMMIFIAFGGIFVGRPYEREKARLKEARKTYVLYLDGVEVSQSVYDYHLYQYSIDDDNHVIFARSN